MQCHIILELVIRGPYGATPCYFRNVSYNLIVIFVTFIYPVLTNEMYFYILDSLYYHLYLMRVYVNKDLEFDCFQFLPLQKSSIPVHVEQERCLRSQISSLIRLYLLVLNCARCTLPTARWYAEKVQAACQAGQKVKVSTTKSKVMEMFLTGWWGLQQADISGSVEEIRNSSALAMELCISCSNPLICGV